MSHNWKKNKITFLETWHVSTKIREWPHGGKCLSFYITQLTVASLSPPLTRGEGNKKKNRRAGCTENPADVSTHCRSITLTSEEFPELFSHSLSGWENKERRRERRKEMARGCSERRWPPSHIFPSPLVPPPPFSLLFTVSTGKLRRPTCEKIDWQPKENGHQRVDKWQLLLFV